MTRLGTHAGGEKREMLLKLLDGALVIAVALSFWCPECFIPVAAFAMCGICLVAP
jgi:hypothetical protein